MILQISKQDCERQQKKLMNRINPKTQRDIASFSSSSSMVLMTTVNLSETSHLNLTFIKPKRQKTTRYHLNRTLIILSENFQISSRKFYWGRFTLTMPIQAIADCL